MDRWKPDKSVWIWVKGDEKPDNAYFQFRKSFKLEQLPYKAIIYVSADCKYLLFVNGDVVGRGPITTDPLYKQVDIYDVSKYLHLGDNAVAALVLQRHAKTSRLWPQRGGFLLQFDSEIMSFGTEEGWAARRAIEYKHDVPFMSHQYGSQEWLDNRLISTGWNMAGFDDLTWERAVKVENAVEYWPDTLFCRQRPHMRRIKRIPENIIGYFSISSKGVPAEHWYEPARQMSVDYIGSSVAVYGIDNLTKESKESKDYATICENSMGGIGIVVDMGEEMLGYPYIEFECPEGVTVDIGHGELLSRNRIQTLILPESGAEQRYADRYISGGGRQRWELFDSKGLRYLEVHFRDIPKDKVDNVSKVVIYDIGVMESSWPETETTEFKCNDELINKIFDICKRTVQVKHQDWFICDAQREQNQWPEFFQAWVYCQVFGKSDLVHYTIDNFVKGQLDSGAIPATIPTIYKGKYDLDNNYIFPTYGFPFMIWLDWLYGGERLLHHEWIDCIQKIYDFLFSFADDDGMPSNTPSNHWVEWSGIDSRPSDIGRTVKHDWRVAYFNGLLTFVLERSADMAESLGKPVIAEDWRKKAVNLRNKAGNIFWNNELGAFIDGVYDGIQSDSVSQTTNSVLVLACLRNEDELKSALLHILNSKNKVINSAMNNMAFLHEALESFEMNEVVLTRIRNIWEKMIRQGATTTWEDIMAPERSMGCCFGFAAHPLTFLVRNILGVIPLYAGYKIFSVRLHPCDIKNAKGKIHRSG